MTKTVSAAEAKNRFGAMLEEVREGNEIVIARHGKPEAVMISFAEREELRSLQEEKRRADAFSRLKKLQHEVSERNKDLTEEEAIELAVRVSHELVDDMADRGAIQFERDRDRNSAAR